MVDDDAFEELRQVVRSTAEALHELRLERDRLRDEIRELRRARRPINTVAAELIGPEPTPRPPLDNAPPEEDPDRLAVLEAEREAVRARLQKLHEALNRLGTAEPVTTGATPDDRR